MEPPKDWHRLEQNDRSSTIAYFVGGWKSDRAHQILIWRGTEYEGEVQLTSHLGNSIPDDAEYIIEVEKRGELVKELFASNREEAWNKANQELTKIKYH